MKHITLAVLAHVDAGKTTLCERLLFNSHVIRRFGSVDSGNTFMDTDAEERSRGITIYSSEARFRWNDTEFTVIDTPGHTDFTAETLRALMVTDCCILVVSGPAGVQGHTRRLAHILREQNIPTIVFVNKEDQLSPLHSQTVTDLQEILPCPVDFSEVFGNRGRFSEELRDTLAMEDEGLLEDILADSDSVIDYDRCLRSASELTVRGKMQPVLFGSARTGDGCSELLDALCELTQPRIPTDNGELSGICYKVTRDEQGVRLSLGRLATGVLRPRDMIGGDKITELRTFAGAKSTPVTEVHAGELFAAAGIRLHPGTPFGAYTPVKLPKFRPTLQASVQTDTTFRNARQALLMLADEEPSIEVYSDEMLGQLRVSVCGEMQLDSLASRLKSRFGIQATFSAPKVILLETLAETTVGRGHFEPLRHYAEVHLRMEPAPRGEGITFRSAVHTDILAQSWQNLIRTHVMERVPKGILTGSALTDVRITLLAARAHEKHTEGGDFREATYRAIRQGLLKGKSILLEPYSSITIEAPVDCAGRVTAELMRRQTELDPSVGKGSTVLITGRAPTAQLSNLALELASITHGAASLAMSFDSYEPVKNPETYIAERAYNPLRDPEEESGSVFCAHGAGFLVPWTEADRYMHLGNPM